MQTLTDIRIYTGAMRREGDDITATGAKIVGNEWVYINADDGSTNIVRVPVGAVCECEPQPIPEPTPQCDNSGSNVLATMLRGADGKTPDMSGYYDKEDIEEKLAYKQDRIDDLETIRKNAEKGSTALQSVPSEYVTEEKLQKKVGVGIVPIDDQPVLMRMSPMNRGMPEEEIVVVSNVDVEEDAIIIEETSVGNDVVVVEEAAYADDIVLVEEDEPIIIIDESTDVVVVEESVEDPIIIEDSNETIVVLDTTNNDDTIIVVDENNDNIIITN